MAAKQEPQAKQDTGLLSAKKNWRCPELRSLPIAATAGNKGAGNEGTNMPKSGDAGPIAS